MEEAILEIEKDGKVYRIPFPLEQIGDGEHMQRVAASAELLAPAYSIRPDSHSTVEILLTPNGVPVPVCDCGSILYFLPGYGMLHPEDKVKFDPPLIPRRAHLSGLRKYEQRVVGIGGKTKIAN